MYNFSEIKNLNELKELCFFIKAIDETGLVATKHEHAGQIKDYLKSRYNLETSVSKLYLFVQKILFVYNKKDKFPKADEIDKIIKAYIAFVHDEFEHLQSDVERAQLNYSEQKLKIGKSEYTSSEHLANDICLSRSLYAKKKGLLLLWSAICALFIVSGTYCVIGLIFPDVLRLYVTKAQEITIVLLVFFILQFTIYKILCFCNRRVIGQHKKKIQNYDKYQAVIKDDITKLNSAKQKLYAKRRQFSVNGLEMTDEVIFNFIKNSDELDIKFINAKINAKQIGRILGLKENKPARFGQVLSRHEQNRQWRDSEQAKQEKQNINNELMARINALAEGITAKGSMNTQLSAEMSDLYCKQLSVSERKRKIDEAESKIILAKNYIDLVDIILAFERTNLLNNTKGYNLPKTPLQVTMEERVSFSESLNIMFNRIEKAAALGLISSGQTKTYKNVQKELESGIIQGVQVDAVNYRYDLAKLYVRLYDELSTYDILN